MALVAKKAAAKKAATKAAPKKAAPKKKAKAKKAASGAVNSPIKGDGNARPTGKTTGLGVEAAWHYIFEKNEVAAGRLKGKGHFKDAKSPTKLKDGKPFTDEQISEWMYAEFPNRGSAAFKMVSSARIKANDGRLPRSLGTPVVQFQRYDEAGQVIAKGQRTAHAEAPKAPAAAKPKAAAKKAAGKPKAARPKAAAKA